MKTKNIIWISSIWIVLMIVSFSWNYHIVVTSTYKIVENKAQSFFSQILVSRSWNSFHGGVYVPITDKTQPNPYLKDTLRDVTTTQGLKLTKINPAYMTRQIAEINKSVNDLQFHITSLNPIRPANKSDEWESKALNSFANGKKEILELINQDSTPVYRYMAPLITQQSCLKCHAIQGYKVGDIRGGISISFPSKIYNDSMSNQVLFLFIAHLIILLVGLLGIYLYFKMLNKFIAIIEQKNETLLIDAQLLRKSNEELRVSLEFNRATVAALPDILYSINHEGYFTNCQVSDTNLLLSPKDGIVGKSLSDVLPPQIASAGLDAISKAIATSKLQIFEYSLDLPNGTRWFEIRIVNSSQKEVLAISRDITDRKYAEQEINNKNYELSKSLAEKDKFFSIIAHDLRSPFNTFLGFTEVMDEGLDKLSKEQVQNMIQMLRRSAVNLFQLLENLLEWSRMQRGLINYNPESYILAPIIETYIQHVSESANKKGVTIHTFIPENLKVFADKNMLGSIIRNLTSNAVKFTQGGGIVTISAKPATSNRIEVSIKDTGIGMSHTMVESLFQFESKTNREGTEGEPSSGLGLVLCKDLIEKHDGILSVESEVGIGSTFYFTLPQSS